MGMETKTVGGGAARKPAANFLNFLNAHIGGNAGIQQAFERLIGGDTSAGVGAIRTEQERSKKTDTGLLNAQFGVNTSSRSGVNAAATSDYLARRAPQDTLQIEDYMDKRQIAALQMLLPLFGQAVGLGTPQAQTIQQKSALGQAFDTGIGLAKTGAALASGNPGLALLGSGPKSVSGTGPAGTGWGGNAAPPNPWE